LLELRCLFKPRRNDFFWIFLAFIRRKIFLPPSSFSALLQELASFLEKEVDGLHKFGKLDGIDDGFSLGEVEYGLVL
jgi:hypothetical protein